MQHILGLIGYPLTHSFSQKYFTEKFENEGITSYKYYNFPLKSIDDFPDLLADKPRLTGLNVTIPYKQSVLKYVDFKDPVVSEIGATNTLLITGNGKIKAYNTDVYGFYHSLKPHLKKHHQAALILGTGGASKAVAYALDRLKIPYLFVSRNPLNQQTVSYKQLSGSLIKDYHLIINTTPLGTFPDVENKPDFPYNFVTEKHFFYDLIYNPSQTLFLREAQKRGAKILNGLNMLKLQAEEAWNIWQKKTR